LTHPVTQERMASVELVIRSLGSVTPNLKEPDLIKKIQIILRSERRDVDAAISEYEKLVQENPTSAEYLHLLGFAQHLKGQLAEAQNNYEKARTLDSNHPTLQRDLGRLYTFAGNLPLARAAFERALAQEQKEPLTYLYLGELFEREGDLRSAAGAYLNAHNLSPLWDKPLYRLGVVYGKLDRLGDAYYYLGRSHLLQDEDERAVADFEKALKILGSDSPRGQLVREELKALRARRR
jgi:tetratricopeptide (TPR) repeat protein